jgi:hypothetical protein
MHSETRNRKQGTGKQDEAFGLRAKADDANTDSGGNVRKDGDECEAAEPLAN